MDAISDIASSSIQTVDTATKKTDSGLGQDEFMKLMLTQMQHQDPFKPTGNTEFIAQMAQFSSVQGIEAMRVSLDNFVSDQASSKMLNAANLVGKSAMIESSVAELATDKPIALEYSLPRATQTATASFTDAAGELVHRIDLGSQAAGSHSLMWDGKTSDNKTAAPGTYNVRVEYPVDDEGNSTAATIHVATTVRSVNLGAGGTELTITTSEGNDVNINDVRKFL